jgi:hypothetical protein
LPALLDRGFLAIGTGSCFLTPSTASKGKTRYRHCSKGKTRYRHSTASKGKTRYRHWVPALRGDRTATSLLPALLDRGFLASDTSYGDVRFAIPDHALRFYFPAFWPEAEQEPATLAAQEQA